MTTRPEPPERIVPSAPPFSLDHVCIAVRRLSTARTALVRMFGYVPRTEPVENTRQQVRVQFLRKQGSIDIKLIEPSTPDSPLASFLSQSGGGLHHIAFRTDATPEAIESLRALGAHIVTPPEPGEAFNDHLIAFAVVASGLRVEIIDTDTRRGELPEA